MAFCPCVFGADSGSFDELASAGLGVGALRVQHEYVKYRASLTGVRFSAGFGEGLIPNLALRSAASFWVLYSILFCSKFASLRYSSNELASETGAYTEKQFVERSESSTRRGTYVSQVWHRYVEEIL